MRDLETIESALRIAETGHLTFCHLAHEFASSTINRIIDRFSFPSATANPCPAFHGHRRILCQALCRALTAEAGPW